MLPDHGSVGYYQLAADRDALSAVRTEAVAGELLIVGETLGLVRNMALLILSPFLCGWSAMLWLRVLRASGNHSVFTRLHTDSCR